MLNLRVRKLTAEEVTNVWPLAQTMPRNNSLLGWMCLVKKIMRRGGGVVGAVAEDGIFHGVATYEAVQSVRAGRFLRVHTLASFELNGRAPVRRALLDELERLAASFGCEAITVGADNRGHVTSGAD